MNDKLNPDSLFTPPVSYCIDANYYKGTTIEQYVKKKRRQLVVDTFDKHKTKNDITMLGGLQAHQHPCSDGICPCVNSAAGMGGGQTPIAIRPGFRVRKLTPKECWRLMGFEDQDFENAKNGMNQNIYNGNDRSSSQLYKQAGNSIVVDVLLHIMENLYEAMPYLFEVIQIGSFFSGIGAFEKALDRLEPNNTHSAELATDNPELHQLGYINGNNGVANRVYDNNLARTLAAEAGGGGAKTGWYRITPPRNPVILDVKQQHREGKPRMYQTGIVPTLAARDYKDPLRVVVKKG